MSDSQSPSADAAGAAGASATNKRGGRDRQAKVRLSLAQTSRNAPPGPLPLLPADLTLQIGPLPTVTAPSVLLLNKLFLVVFCSCSSGFLFNALVFLVNQFDFLLTFPFHVRPRLFFSRPLPSCLSLSL